MQWVRAAQPTPVAVAGEVTNGTSGASVPDDLVLTVHTFSDVEESGTYSTTVGGDQSFGFENLSLGEGDTVVARAIYDGVTYVSEFVTVEQDQGEISLPLTILSLIHI